MDAFKINTYIKSENFSSVQGKLYLLILIIGLVIGITQFFSPISNWISPVIESAESDANKVAATALVTFGAARGINATISFLQDVSFSVSFFGGTEISPFKLFEPLDDMIERFSEMLFYMLVAFKVMAISFTPIVALSGYLLGFGLIGTFVKHFFRQFENIQWPRKLLTIGMFTLLFPLSFKFSMLVGGLTLDRLIISEQDVLIGVNEIIEEERVEKVSENSDKVLRIESEKLGNGWWDKLNPFSGDDNKELTSEDSEVENENSSSWWKFWEESDEPGYLGKAWDQFKSIPGIIATLTAKANNIIDSALTLLALYLMKLILIPAVFLYFSFRILKTLISGDNNFVDMSIGKMNPFRSKEER